MNQAALTALLSFALGFLLGAFYDIIRLPRMILGITVQTPFKKGRFNFVGLFGYAFVAIGDFVFFAVSAVLMSVFFFLTGDGRARGYALLLTFGGFLAYYNTLGRLFLFIASKVIAVAKKAVRICCLPLTLAFSRLKIIFDMPIVKSCIKRYNNYITKRKKRAKVRRAAKKARRYGSFVNSVQAEMEGGSRGGQKKQ